MQEELKRSSSIGNSECIDRFLYLIFVEKVFGIEALNVSFRYHSIARFNCHIAILFFEDLGLFKTSKYKITLTDIGEEISSLTSEMRKLKISQMVLKRLLDNKLVNLEKVKIDSLTGELKIPINAFSLSGAIYRNYLYESGFFVRDNSYLIFKDEKISSYVEDQIIVDKRKTSQQELLIKLKNQQEDGDSGELFVMEYEIGRLSQSKLTPRRVSLIDVGAGYDILSYESSQSLVYDRYIEVKAFRGTPHFYWSLNEKNVAEVLGDKYYIYLVDLNQMENNPHSYVPIVIQNPAEELKNEKWFVEATSFHISLIQ